MTEQLTDHEKAQLAAEDKQVRAWVRIQQEESDKAAYNKQWENIGRMSDVEALNFISAECAKGDAAKRAKLEQEERERSEQGARDRQAARG